MSFHMHVLDNVICCVGACPGMVGRPADGGSVVPDSTLCLCCGFCTVRGADPVMIALHSDSASVCAFCEHQVHSAMLRHCQPAAFSAAEKV